MLRLVSHRAHLTHVATHTKFSGINAPEMTLNAVTFCAIATGCSLIHSALRGACEFVITKPRANFYYLYEELCYEETHVTIVGSGYGVPVCWAGLVR